MGKKKKVILTDKKPIDEYKCIKVPLKKILKDSKNIDKIEDCVNRANKIIIKAYQLLRLWILNEYEKTNTVPKIDRNKIQMIQKSLFSTNKGRSPSKENLLFIKNLNNLHKFEKEDGLHLSQVLMYDATFMITAIENNIKKNFQKHLNIYLNAYFKNKYGNKLAQAKFRHEIKKDIKCLEKDLMENTKKSNEKYHKWLDKNRSNIVPSTFKKNHFYYLKCKPQEYLKHMIWMNRETEKNGGKILQVLPLRSNIVPSSISIDTKTLIEIFINGDKLDYLKNLSNKKKEVWDKLFDFNVKINGFQFDYTISTDGYSASLRFINNKLAEKEKLKKERMSAARKEKNKKTSNINEKNKIIKKVKTVIKKPTSDVTIKYVEYLYIDEVDKKVFENRKNIYVDPGKRSLFFMIDDYGNKLDYTNRRRITETKRLKYQRLISNFKDELGISKIENELTDFNSKSCFVKTFKKYIIKKNQINKKLFEKYKNYKFRQYRWYAYINTKRSEDNMLNLIEEKYGKNINLIMGDASVKHNMNNFISTPNVHLKSKLKSRFPVYHIDEFRSSCLHYKTEERCGNLYYEDKLKRTKLQNRLSTLLKMKKNKIVKDEIKYIKKYLAGGNKLRKLHSVLTYKMENNRRGCINRDLNACLNLKKIFKHYLKTGKRPDKYCRSLKIKKVDNPVSKNKIETASNVDKLSGVQLHDNLSKSKILNSKHIISKIENQIKKEIIKSSNILSTYKKLLEKYKSNVKNKTEKFNIDKINQKKKSKVQTNLERV